jgi:hypothetical protein
MWPEQETLTVARMEPILKKRGETIAATAIATYMERGRF